MSVTPLDQDVSIIFVNNVYIRKYMIHEELYMKNFA